MRRQGLGCKFCGCRHSLRRFRRRKRTRSPSHQGSSDWSRHAASVDSIDFKADVSKLTDEELVAQLNLLVDDVPPEKMPYHGDRYHAT